ncbi:MAG: TAFII55 protein conserved region-domain-containing protein [Linnemannia elongata]|nr:MAG: TAFII55 protein conserved region-domain-containing protein [Linnemannia elongata]
MGAAKSGRPKGPYKKAGGAGGGGGGPSKRGGRGGGRGGRASSSFGPDDDDDKGGKDSDDDNEDEPEVSIEEQFILRLPPGEMLDRFREKVIAREVDESVKLKFTDARRGTFTFEGIDFPTKLVDLPTIIEAQKTLNGKQMYKIADISQMLIVDEVPAEKVIKTEPGAGSRDPASEVMPAPTLPPLKPSEYIWPDGLTNPLKNVRKRRFRKRVSKVAVEGVEAEIERLLQEDAQAEEVVYEMREQVDGMDRFDSDDGATPAPEGAQSDLDMDDNDGEMMDMDEEEEEDEDEEDDEYEKDLLAELEREIAQDDDDDEDDDDDDEEEEEEEEDDDDDEDSGSDEDDEDDDEDDKEKAQVEKLLKDEIKELDSKIQENEEKLQSAPNEILKKRFNLIVEQLRKELELKKSQLEEARGKSKGK